MGNLITPKLVEEASKEYTGEIGYMASTAVDSRLLDAYDASLLGELMDHNREHSEVRFMFACFILLMAGEEV